MRSVILFCVFAWSAVVMGQNEDMKNMPKYDDRYDYLEVDAIFDSKRLVRNYVDCLINMKPCTPEGKSLKRLLPEALRTKCVRCTDRQKRTAVKVIKKLKYEYPEEWAKLSSRWDPTGDFTRYFEEFVAKEEFNTISDTGNDIGYPTIETRPVPATNPPMSTPETSKPALVPVLLNRFGEDDDTVAGSSAATPQPTKQPSTNPTKRPPISPIDWKTTKPTQSSWIAAASEPMPTRFSYRPTDVNPPITTAITLIDHIGYKIMRTTELVTDILKETVRAVVGR